MKKINTLAAAIGLCAVVITSQSYAAEKPLTFAQAINIALRNDPWLEGSQHKQKALELMSQAANSQPDPNVSIAFANLPTDSFDLSQEGMTQLKIGVTQMFARGDSLAIKNKQLLLESQQQPLLRQNRKNQLTVTVGNLWLDLYRVEQSIKLITENRQLFAQLTELADLSYGSGLAKTKQLDMVRAQLELTQLEDKLTQLTLEKDRYQGMLRQWLSAYRFNEQTVQQPYIVLDLGDFQLHQQLPQLALNKPAMVYGERPLQTEQLARLLAGHPSVLTIDKKIAATSQDIKLAEQKYQPQWGINASYGYRDDDLMGNSRADLFSLGVVFDLPLFTGNKQDVEVQSAIANSQAIKTEKLLLIRQLMSAFSSAKGRLLRVKERQVLYQERLLPQTDAQTQTLLSAYSNHDGDFAAVVRARIAELNAKIEFLTINVEEQKITLEINYLVAGTSTALAMGE